MRPVLVSLTLVLLAGCAKDQSAEVAALKAEVERLTEIAGPPPATLDQLYPPIAKEPAWLLAMHGMAERLMATMIKVTQGDMASATKYFGQFREAYTKTSALVPEWTSRFPTGPLDEVAAALESGPPDKVMAAVGKLGAVCDNCHFVNMPKVQMAKHWSDSGVLSLTDPLSRQAVPYKDFMMSLEMALMGIGVELAEGHAPKAQEYFAAFNAGMGELRGACGACHDSERMYYVDKSVQATVDAIGSALKSPQPDVALVRDLVTKIGTESCGRCHLVHVPAMYAQKRFKAWGAASAGTAAGGGAAH